MNFCLFLGSAHVWLRPGCVYVSMAWNTYSLLLSKSEHHHIWHWYMKILCESLTPKNSMFLDGRFSGTDAGLHQLFEMLFSKTRHALAWLASEYSCCNNVFSRFS